MATEQEQHTKNPTAPIDEPSIVMPDDSDDLSQQKAPSAIPNEVQQCGPYGSIVFVKGDNGVINQPAAAADFSSKYKYGFCPLRREHFKFSSVSGIWELKTPKEALWDVTAYIKELSESIQLPQLSAKCTPGFLKNILQLVEGHAPLPQPTSSKLIPVANGVLDLSSGKAVLRPFAEEDYFTFKLPIPYVSGAKCERFLNELIRPALDSEDEDLIQRDLGRMLIRGNAAQTLSIFTGPGGTGKSVLVSVLEGVIGKDMFAHLRSDQLGGRFETHAFQGKSILVGKDVSHDYLLKKGAAMFKSLTGDDWLETEQKYGGKFGMRGNFNAIITANSRLPIAINGDASALRRRFVCYEFSRKTPPKRIPNFDQVLICEEGEKILAWLVEGCLAHEAELAEHGTLKLTEAQQKRVDDWIMESEPERSFAKQCIVQQPGTLSVEEIWEAYVAFARERKWRVPSMQAFCTKLPHILMEMFGVQRSNHIKRGDTAVRGFKGISFKHEAPEGKPAMAKPTDAQSAGA